MGHTTTGMIFAHYREVVSLTDAAPLYWNIRAEQGRNSGFTILVSPIRLNNDR